MTSEGIVAPFNASDDTIDMIQWLLIKADAGQTLIWCHFADLKKGVVDFEHSMRSWAPIPTRLKWSARRRISA